MGNKLAFDIPVGHTGEPGLLEPARVSILPPGKGIGEFSLELFVDVLVPSRTLSESSMLVPNALALYWALTSGDWLRPPVGDDDDAIDRPSTLVSCALTIS